MSDIQLDNALKYGVLPSLTEKEYRSSTRKQKGIFLIKKHIKRNFSYKKHINFREKKRYKCNFFLES